MVHAFSYKLILLTNTLIVSAVLFAPSLAAAFFSDTETSDAQRFKASELLFEGSFDNQEFYMGPGLATEHTFTLPIEFSSSSVANKYDISVSSASGDEVFCDALALTTSLSGSDSSGYFESFASSPYSEAGEVLMTLSYDDSERAIAHNDSCTAEIVVEAWQENMSKATAGYRDRKTFTLTVIAHMVVLNEVLARPNTTDTQVPNVEFIELYNNSDFPVDVLGWNITELTAGGLPTNHLIANINTAPASALIAYDGSLSTVVPAHGHLALKYRGSSSYLNDTGDTITLIDTTTGVAVDVYRYEVALVGKSDARIPDGVGAWIDPIPTPDEENILAEELPLVATSTATSSIFTELSAEQEIASSTSTSADEVATSTASSTPTEPVVEEVVVPLEEDVSEVPEELVLEVVSEPVIGEEEVETLADEPEPVPEPEPLPLSDTNSAESALLDPEPVVKNSEEEVVIEEVVETPPET